jgi:hypothetical protein
MRWAVLAAFGMLAFASVARAHPGHADDESPRPANLRVWRLAKSFVEFEAAFVAVNGERVVLARRDGSPTWVPLRELSPADREWIAERVAEVKALNETLVMPHVAIERAGPPVFRAGVVTAWTLLAVPVVLGFGVHLRRRGGSLPVLVFLFGATCLLFACARPPEPVEEIVVNDGGAPPAIAAHFAPFQERVKVRWNDDTLFVESNGLPDHPMMVGITNWQQQVPLPQPYTGNNAWRIPLRPRMAETPISAKKALFRGAIALAINGVPIFNALNNRGEDAFLIGELDEYGGHCGKGDDYHYHAAPLHLQKLAGAGKPIGYALDGFPLYGLTDQKLDEFNGRFDEAGNYRYHSTKTYPYINGGLKGVVQVRNDGVEPQPRAGPVREAQRPLRGAKITAFTVDEAKKNFSLTYEVAGGRRTIDYSIEANDSFKFTFTDDAGRARTETYTRREGKGDGKKKKGKVTG